MPLLHRNAAAVPKTRPQNSTKSSFAREGLPSKFPTEVSGLMQKRQMSWQYAEVRCDNLRPASRTLLSNSPVLRIVSTCAVERLDFHGLFDYFHAI